MKASFVTAVAVASALVATSAIAQTKTETGINYNQVGIGYVSSTVSGSNGKDYTFSGPGISGEVLLGNTFLINASALSLKGDVDGTNVTVDVSNVGFGARTGIGQHADVFGRVSFLSSNGSGGTTSSSANGYNLTVGVKGMLSQSVVGSVFAGYTKYNTTDATSPFGVGLDFNVTKEVVIGTSYLVEKDTRQLGLTVSYAF